MVEKAWIGGWTRRTGEGEGEGDGEEASLSEEGEEGATILSTARWCRGGGFERTGAAGGRDKPSDREEPLLRLEALGEGGRYAGWDRDGEVGEGTEERGEERKDDA